MIPRAKADGALGVVEPLALRCCVILLGAHLHIADRIFGKSE
jgi:hypothetical protein